MADYNSFGIIGGDRRQLALAESIAADGYAVYACGFANADFQRNIQKADLEMAAMSCKNLILPLPVTTDGKTLKAEYADEPITLDDGFAELCRGHKVFVGMQPKLVKTSPIWNEIDVRDYYTREEFAIRNAMVTAEGALEVAMHEFPGALCMSRCLVAGFGRIGKQLVPRLRAMGAEVTASARKASDLAMIESMGVRAVQTADAGFEGPYHIVFNTVPTMLFDRRMLSRMEPGTLMIDLSSAPGGVEVPAAEKLGIRVVHAFSLPAKVAPQAAGEIIKQTVYAMMEE